MCYNNYVGDNVAKIVLVCGIHGSGKSTLLRTMHGYTILAASEVIRNNNNGKCDNKKEVASIDNNQDVLLKSLSNFTTSNELILLDGHTCLLDENRNIQKIPFSFFQQMQLLGVVFVDCESYVIKERLVNRNIYWDLNFINEFKRLEYEYAIQISETLRIKFVKVHCDNVELFERFLVELC